MLFRLSKGLDLPILGVPDQRVSEGKPVTNVAVLGNDYIGLKPTMLVQVGDNVKNGQPLFEDKKNPGVLITAPAAGEVTQINRGAKRVLLSVVIKKHDADKQRKDQIEFEHYPVDELHQLEDGLVRENLIKSGLWTALRTRPYSKVPAIDAKPSAIFVTAIDTNPLAANPEVVLNGQEDEFRQGLTVLANFGVKTHLCKAPSANIPSIDSVEVSEFAGPHPAGLPGTHIHFIDPVNANKQAWYINYQDVVSIGKLFATGQLSTEKIISLGGPMVSSPRLISTELGASLDDLLNGAALDGEKRVISGSVLNGNIAADETCLLYTSPSPRDRG